MSDSSVTLELKTVIYSRKLPVFQFCESLALEHSESNTYFIVATTTATIKQNSMGTKNNIASCRLL
ncbi:MAG: hypothetical protein A2275_13920 [Bacteroidetes bacterium RIFOXYA12_FULL_35_11]|nr:MAG: hypothetical protein A2X01_13165 [Bacteroidetes bacterium GWF2_35_48]OFY80407.1 MAG: hypothetical protein A2275_13920 [Bacteroidetes bacterium RIFOXYA12_FULL_35_11]OFY96641.1 MAG: hypothetical protein A2309_05610 [Bacteroidetes bacterium RIFOXYB2_FULL_35_7]HBX51861.1 hypothetical protein [Bacteroidales bacterium]